MLLFACKKREPEPWPNRSISCEEGMRQTDSLYLLAAQLTYELVNADTLHPSYNEVFLPPRLHDSIFSQLKAIKALSEGDTIFRLCNIQRAYTDSLLRWFTIKSSRVLCKEKAISYTYYLPCPPADSIVFACNAEATSVKAEPYPGQPGQYSYIANMLACRPINTKALAKKLKQTGKPEAVTLFQPVYVKPVRATIKTGPGYTEYEFGYGWDCGIGCNYWRYWVFRVESGNNATFIKSFGDDGPVF